MIIAISGPHGSGKSTIAKALAKHFGLRYISAGELFRSLAKENGMDIVEFTKYVEENPDVDIGIDKRTEIEAEKGNVVIDAQLGYWFARKYNPLSILVIANLEDRARRVSERENITFEEALKQIKIRDENEKKRFKKLYNVDLWNVYDFHFVINTSKISKEKTIELMIELCRKFFEG
ncbi:MAG: (d)CMP kinase [Candidatus Njordarchaeia archaeon]